MKAPGLIGLSLILVLASHSKGQAWEINLPERHIKVDRNSDVTIPCNFTYPKKHHTENVSVYWKKPGRSPSDIGIDQDKNAFIFHPNENSVLDNYKGKTKLIGNITTGNCSLLIKNITENEPNIYVRVIGKGDQYSFKKNSVSIFMHGVQVPNNTDDIFVTTTTTTTGDMLEMTSVYVGIFVPVTLLIIIFVVGMGIFCLKHKRSKSFTREDSGYYANFSRSSSNQANREACCKIQDNKKLHEPKAIVEPIYINMEAPADQMDQSMAHTDNIYANMDYPKK